MSLTWVYALILSMWTRPLAGHKLKLSDAETELLTGSTSLSCLPECTTATQGDHLCCGGESKMATSDDILRYLILTKLLHKSAYYIKFIQGELCSTNWIQEITNCCIYQAVHAYCLECTFWMMCFKGEPSSSDQRATCWKQQTMIRDKLGPPPYSSLHELRIYAFFFFTSINLILAQPTGYRRSSKEKNHLNSSEVIWTHLYYPNSKLQLQAGLFLPFCLHEPWGRNELACSWLKFWVWVEIS